jgi:uncharacterized FlaG/YvyC family protein
MKIDPTVPNGDLFAQPTTRVQEVQSEQRELIQAVRAVNASGQLGFNNELTFAFDRQTQKLVIKIVNRDTNEVIDQIPAERVLRMAEDLKLMWHAATGR